MCLHAERIKYKGVIRTSDNYWGNNEDDDVGRSGGREAWRVILWRD